MIDDITRLVAAYVAKTYEVAREQKSDVTNLEVEGLAFRMLVSALDNYQNNEQLQESRPIEGTEGTGKESEQVQRVGETRGIEDSPQGIRSEQTGLTKSGRKKRRSKATAAQVSKTKK